MLEIAVGRKSKTFCLSAFCIKLDKIFGYILYFIFSGGLELVPGTCSKLVYFWRCALLAFISGFNDDQTGVISQLIDAENLAASDITYNFIEALKTYFASIGDGVIPSVEDLQNNALIQSAIKMSQATTAYNTNKAGRDKAVASESSFKQDMTQAEAETFYSNYWGNEKM